MHFRKLPTAVALLAASLPLSLQANTTDACAEIAQRWAKSDTVVDFPGKLAQDCLTSIPYDGKRAKFIVDQLRLYFQFFAAQTFYKDPPSFFEILRVDANATFDYFDDQIGAGNVYKNNLQFDHEVMNFFGSFRHSAVDYVPACASAFIFRTDHPLFAVSPDGPTKEPQIHVVLDPYGEPHLGPQVDTINGAPVLEYLKGLTTKLPELHYVDPDARWNDLFFHRSNGAARLGVFAQRFIYPEDPIVLKYKDGKEVKVEWTGSVFSEVAALTEDGINLPWKDKDSFLHNVCLKSQDTTKCKKKDSIFNRKLAKRANPNEVKLEGMWGYPAAPAVATYGQELTLHLFDKYSVLVISSFAPHPGNAQDALSFIMEFQEKLADAVAAIQAKDKATGKKRPLLIDLSHNDGGKQILAHEAAKVFLPKADHFFQVNRRYSPALEALTTADFKVNGNSIFNPQYFKTAKGGDFKDGRELLGPVSENGDYFTQRLVPDHDELMSIIWQDKKLAKLEEYWNHTDITVIADGLCNGACGILLEALQAQKVKVAAFGGRPGSWTMQGAGGLKGHSPLSFSDLDEEIYYILGDKASGNKYLPKPLPINLMWGSVGLENRFRKDEKTPMQFQHVKATWTAKYTQAMFQNAKAIWEHAYYLASGEVEPTSPKGIFASDPVTAGGNNKDAENTLEGKGGVWDNIREPFDKWNLGIFIFVFFSGESPSDKIF
ncbi:hypothetical protein DFH27DRAFT_560016 [Peziza echinospora]|nr:hypothetical protein DFH27DRAFT_560016 [Peziza echinospora]